MKKRNLLLCGILSAAMVMEAMVPALAESAATEQVTESSGQSQKRQAPPEKPDGETGVPDGQQTPPEMPGGPGGEMPDGQGGPGGMPGAPGDQGEMPGGQAGGVESYDSVNEYTEDAVVEGETITSAGTNENAVLVSGENASVVLKDVTVSRISQDSSGGDNASFYGVGAALLATAGELNVSGANIDTGAAGGAGVFAYGDGTVYVADSTITTDQDTSGGIHAAGGGTLYAWDLDVTTEGNSSAAIRSDRGGGTMVVDGGTYTSNGNGSPAVYCTADISINNAELTANGSEAVCIEGLNTLRLYDCDLTGNMTDMDQNDCTWNVIVYQSMSGDSEAGNGTFQMVGGTLTARNGGMFYTTNTECTITLEDVEIIPAQENDFFLRCTGNANDRGWGQTESNGSDCLFTAIAQIMEGDVIWDSISELDFYMTDGSTLTGAIVQDESYAGDGGNGYCNVYIDENSSWIVTGDSTVTALCQAGAITDDEGSSVTIVGTDGTVYQEGDSQYTITVETYTDSANTQVITWAHHFLIANSLCYCLLTIVNVWRFAIQGMGYSMFAICSGVLEMAARTIVAFTAVPALGFHGVCLASPLAWVFAVSFLIPAFYHCVKKVRLMLGQEAKTSRDAKAAEDKGSMRQTRPLRGHRPLQGALQQR